MAKMELKTGVIWMTGTIGKIELREFGESKTKCALFSVAIGKDENGNTLWEFCEIIESKTHDFYQQISVAEKGTAIMIMGHKESRTFNEKVYTKTRVEFMVLANRGDKVSASIPAQPAAEESATAQPATEETAPTPAPATETAQPAAVESEPAPAQVAEITDDDLPF